MPIRAVLLGLILWAPMALADAAPGQSPDTAESIQRQPWESCRYCHGRTAGEQVLPVPVIDGLSQPYIAKQLADFRAGRRQDPSEMMGSALILLDERDEWRVAGHFSRLSPPSSPSGHDTLKGSTLYRTGRPGVLPCASCHGLPDPPANYPRLFGQGRAYLSAQLARFRQGKRSNDPGQLMRNIASALTPEETTAIVDYLAGR
jgi:cytochrome c553